MQRSTFIWRSAAFHWRTNLAVAVGAAVGTAVLTGALLVGDSMRGSLLRLTLDRLGRVHHALVAGTFVRGQLVADLAGSADFQGTLGNDAKACSVILIPGTVERLDDRGSAAQRAGGVNIIGIDAAFLGLMPSSEGPPPERGQVWLNERVADEIGATVGGRIVIRFERPSALPRETLLGRRSETMGALAATAARTRLDPNLSRFGLRPNQFQPKNVFVPLEALQRVLGREGRVNTILVTGPAARDVDQAPATSARLQDRLRDATTLDDYALTLRTPESKAAALFDRSDRNNDGRLARGEFRRLPTFLRERADADGDGELSRDEVGKYFHRTRRYVSLESDQLLVPTPALAAARTAASQVGLSPTPVLSYLVNDIALGEKHVPYSIVTAAAPKGANVTTQAMASGRSALEPGAIVLTSWAAERLGTRRGDEVTLTYYLPEARNGVLPTGQTTLRVSEILPLDDTTGDDGWTPPYPGITDADTMARWDPPYEGFVDLDRIDDDDEAYWERYRTAPKAFVSLEQGQTLWSSRFGEVTSIRLAVPEDRNVQRVAEAFESALLEHLRPEQLGLAFRPVRAEGIAASRGGTDFAGLFIGLSFFLILSAALLVGLLFRLNIEQRGRQIGLLLAVGHTPGSVRRLLLLEGTVLVAIAGIVGVAVGVGYGRLMILGLTTWWVGAIGTAFIELVVTPATLAIGYAAGGLTALVAIWWAVRVLARLSPRALLAGNATVIVPPKVRRRQGRRAIRVAVGAGCVALCGMVAAFAEVVSEVVGFYLSGTAALVASLAAVWSMLQWERAASTLRAGPAVMFRLAARNTMQHTSRSVLTISLIAAATFIVVVVAANRRDVGGDVYAKNAGTGGFRLIAEAASPLHHRLSSEAGRRALDIPDEAAQTIARARVYPFRVRPGEEASCLNLYKPSEPRIIAAPPELIERGGFAFKSSLAGTAEETANPWRLLDKDLGAEVIPAFGDYSSVMWILHLGLGKELELTDDHGRPVRLRLMGLLGGSILQSELVISERHFKAHFPSHAGYRHFLIEATPAEVGALGQVLETSLSDYGFDVTDTGRRLAEYMTIQNTYLDTFRTLGGFGLLLGTVGMGVVLLRNVLERRGELALLRALGFRRTRLSFLVMAENAYLLALGLAAGTVSALLAVGPHVFSDVADVRWTALAGTLGLVVVSGLLAGLVAAAAAMAAPLLPALRSE